MHDTVVFHVGVGEVAVIIAAMILNITNSANPMITGIDLLFVTTDFMDKTKAVTYAQYNYHRHDGSHYTIGNIVPRYKCRKHGHFKTQRRT
jgi:hypothetical protein